METKLIIDVATGNEVIEPLTDAEAEQLLIEGQEAMQREAEAQAKAAALKAEKEALLEKLGLTKEEADILLS